MTNPPTTPGRPRVPAEERTVARSITLRPAEWAALAAADPDGSPTREAQRRLRRSIADTTTTKEED